MRGLVANCGVLLGDAAYRRRFGFMSRPWLILPGVPEEYFMALLLVGTWPAGEVQYHATFEPAM